VSNEEIPPAERYKPCEDTLCIFIACAGGYATGVNPYGHSSRGGIISNRWPRMEAERGGMCTHVFIYVRACVRASLEVGGHKQRHLQVEVTHDFSKKGRLLQRTLEQRARRERATDTSLNVRVTQPKALLSVQVERRYTLCLIQFTHMLLAVTQVLGARENLLQGELCRVRLLIRNHGHAPASNLSLKLNQPWLVLLSPSTRAVDRTEDADGTKTPQVRCSESIRHTL
jgi:hypothetical protein